MAEYIEREALYEKAYWHGEMPDVGNPYAEGVEAVDISDVDAIPAADVTPVVHGRCDYCKDGRSFIGQTIMIANDGKCHTIHYCPNCGAKMDVTDINVGDKEG